MVLPGAPALHRINIRPEFSAVDTFRNVLKYGELVNKADQIPDVMRRAFHHLRNGRPGPVMIELPSDVGASEINIDIDSYHSPTKSTQLPSISSIKDTVSALLKAKNPIIWSGMGVLFSQSTEELKELAELLITKGADVNVKNAFGRTPLDYSEEVEDWYSPKDKAALYILVCLVNQDLMKLTHYHWEQVLEPLLLLQLNG